MNKLFATAGMALVILGAGCAPSSGPVYISRFMPIQPDCTADTTATTFVSGGTLDVGAGSPSYFVGLELARLTANVTHAIRHGLPDAVQRLHRLLLADFLTQHGWLER